MTRIALALMVLLLLMPAAARAQSGAACPISQQAPRQITTTAYTLTGNDECNVLVFTNPLSVAVTMPANLTNGYSLTLMSTGGGLTLTPPAGSTVNSSPTGIVGQWQSATLYWNNITASATLSLGNGFFTQPASGAAFTNYANVVPGTVTSNSPVAQLPNGVLQITNPASVIANAGDAFAVCGQGKVASTALPGRKSTQLSSWFLILDSLGQPWRVPLC